MKPKVPREISFRVWDGREMRFPPALGEWDDSDHHHFFTYNKKPSVMMQFTGLTDKNGEKIYEGDILAIKFHPRYYSRISWKGVPDCIAKVIWDFSGFRLAAKGKEDSRYADFHDEKGSYKMFEMSLKHTKVLGNIYENPELLP